jgi:anti-sigma regulatory factor (Ser/Thr protein kinase)
VTDAAGADDDGVFHASRLEDLAALMDFVDRACHAAGADEDMAFAIRLAVEEAFTNVVQHGYASGSGPVAVAVDADAQRIAITLVDEAAPFDPADAPAPDLDAMLEEREPGGLGWHLVQQLMDGVKREPGIERGNVLTLVKRFPGAEAGSQGGTHL